MSVLEELGIEEKDTLLVLNKIDALADRAQLDGLLEPLSERDSDQRPAKHGPRATGRPQPAKP